MTRSKTRRKPAYPDAHRGDTQHIAAIQARADKAWNLTPTGTRRIAASFPAVEELLDLLGWLIDAADPTAAVGIDTERVIVTQTSNDSDGIERASSAVARFVSIQRSTNDALDELTRILRDKVEANDHDRWRQEAPRCWHRDCVDDNDQKTRGRRQPIDATECQWCRRPFADAGASQTSTDGR